ncbi:DNA polymerase III delta [Mesotoga sp. Brook.08.YT.4.2.5.1]|nr:MULTISPECIES: DNA polymerase III subunit delta [unclassified Mesotoga]PNE23070.1 DNA polymerase III delta [Mesotoga sp. Brook.08.YT.4.2.5.1]PNS42004.1 DNA polymerase III delta [Mesotoga sp. B105.6.4]PVD15859.1 hypothetical protein V512_002765 [Mesotoga sp. Brook.08.105.5.1]RAO97882.1 hypothetical protein M388_09225 [Mesotoga sp. Brook.08.YT.4.2.5.4.]RDI93883.1 DNA polymerase III subunit delta [Mesotoga sp. Brook.08.YT.4.2.5.2.]
MIYEITGDSEVLKDFFIRERATGFFHISEDMPDKSVKFRTAISTVGMFGPKPVKLSKFDLWKKEERKAVEALIFSLGEEIDVFIEGRLNIDVESEKHIFVLPKPWEDDKWQLHTMKIAKLIGKTISRAAAEVILSRVGKKEFRILRELEKLSVLSPEIDEKTVEKFIDFDIATEVEFLAVCFLSNDESFLSFAKESSVPFTYFSSVLAKLAIDLGTILEKRKGRTGVTWTEIKDISSSTGIASARVAKLLGYSFSNMREKRVNLSLLHSRLFLKNLIVFLQELDESIKNGQSNQQLSFFQLVGESSNLK